MLISPIPHPIPPKKEEFWKQILVQKDYFLFLLKCLSSLSYLDIVLLADYYSSFRTATQRWDEVATLAKCIGNKNTCNCNKNTSRIQGPKKQIN